MLRGVTAGDFGSICRVVAKVMLSQPKMRTKKRDKARTIPTLNMTEEVCLEGSILKSAEESSSSPRISFEAMDTLVQQAPQVVIQSKERYARIYCLRQVSCPIASRSSDGGDMLGKAFEWKERYYAHNYSPRLVSPSLASRSSEGGGMLEQAFLRARCSIDFRRC